MRCAWLLTLALPLMACNPEQNVARRSQTDTFTQEPPADVDILWVVDNSPSMAQEQKEIARRFEDFIVNLESTNIQFNLGVITTDLDPDNDQAAVLVGNPTVLTDEMPQYETLFADRIQVGTGGSMREQGLEAAWRALTEPLISDANSGFLRDDAVLSIIFVSDEDDCSDRGALGSEADQSYCYKNKDLLVPIRDYIEAFQSLKESPDQVLASSIVGPPVSQGCQDSVPGERYMQLSGHTGGIVGDICDQDFTGIMDEMGLSVSGMRSSFQLTYDPVITTLEVWVGQSEVVYGTINGWTYDETTRYLTFHGEAVPDRGSTITVGYEIAAS